MDKHRSLILKVITASMALLTYVGARNIIDDVQTLCGGFFSSNVVKALTIFSITFLRVEDIWVAFLVAAAYIVFKSIYHILYERDAPKRDDEDRIINPEPDGPP